MMDFGKLIQTVIAALVVWLFTQVNTLQVENAEMRQKIDKMEVGIDKHVEDPKLHHTIKESISGLEKSVAVLTDRLVEIDEGIDRHQTHPILHENIVTLVKVLEERIMNIENQIDKHE